MKSVVKRLMHDEYASFIESFDSLLFLRRAVSVAHHRDERRLCDFVYTRLMEEGRFAHWRAVQFEVVGRGPS